MRVTKLIGLLTFLLSSLTYAGVNLKNGNFFITYTDIVVPGGGRSLDITRTYNSKSTEMGWFGFGWGSDFETFISPASDGSVVVHENGSGALTRFTPSTKVNAKAAAEKIVDAMRKKSGSALADKTVASLIKKLSNDAELRMLYAKQFGVKASIPKGTKLYSNSRGQQSLEKTADGYLRVSADGKKEYFNEKGNLAKIVYKDKHTINFNYKKDILDNIKDSQGKQLFFKWYSDGKVKSIASAGDKKATYEYKGKDLDISVDVAGNKYDYDYDNNHNLIAVNYADKTKMAISYEPKTQFVSKIKARSGKETGYKYGSDPKNPDFHYWTEVTKKDFTGKPITNKYEYEIRTKPDGEHYTYRILTVINGLQTETIYSECCSLPLKIQRGDKVTNFEYNKDGLLTKKTSGNQHVAIDYNKRCKKIEKVKNNNQWTEFDYDKKCNLNKAINSRGKSIYLVYDRKGRITKMVDKNQKDKKSRTLSFKYNAMGKPVEIKLGKIGKINVAYDNYGTIKKVESKQGHRMALQVTQAFQNLLSIVKPAGVNLSL